MNEKIIYLKGYPKQGEVWMEKPDEAFVWHRKNPTRRLARLASHFFIGAGITAVLLLLAPFLFWEISWRLGRLGQPTATNNQESKFFQIIRVSDLNLLNPVDPYFSLIIPKIGLNTVIAANVPVDEKENYSDELKKGVAHAAGTGFPGENNTIYLFGHSSEYLWDLKASQPSFYLLNKLEPGDQVNLFYQDSRYVYQVVDKKVVQPDELSFLKPRPGEEKLILQTCWPLGTNWKRLIVLANRV